jgi:hypothetical protein
MKVTQFTADRSVEGQITYRIDLDDATFRELVSLNLDQRPMVAELWRDYETDQVEIYTEDQLWGRLSAVPV